VKIKGDIVDRILLAFIALFLILCVVVVRDAAAEHGHSPVHVPRAATWQPPPIPQCDKELWLRIKDGCDDA